MENKFLSIKSENILVVNVSSSSRQNWTETLEGEKLIKIFPNSFETAEIAKFVERGGNVIVSLIDPEKKLQIDLYSEENLINQDNVEKMSDNGIDTISFFPYEWIPKKLKRFIVEAYSSSKRNIRIDNMIALPETFIYETGFEDGKFIISKKLNFIESECLDSDIFKNILDSIIDIE